MLHQLKKHLPLVMIGIFVLLLSLELCARIREQQYQQDLADHILRLHVLAASDSETDQEHKLLVRDALLSEMQTYMNDASSKEEAIALVNAHLSELEDTAEAVLLASGDTHSVSVSISNDLFPVKTYGALTFPAGYYDALRVSIGEAEGHNWWCVMYPTLCFVDAACVTVPNEALSTLQENLEPATYQSLFQEEEETKTVFRFRYLTFLNRFLEQFSSP